MNIRRKCDEYIQCIDSGDIPTYWLFANFYELAMRQDPFQFFQLMLFLILT